MLAHPVKLLAKKDSPSLVELTSSDQDPSSEQAQLNKEK